MTGRDDRQQPLISVITAVRNGARYLTHALDSIFRQSYRPIQVIVVDGQSTDGSDEIARSYAGVEYVAQSALGLGAARNQGIDQARGEFIAFLDHDDYWPAAKLDLQLRYMVAHPHLLYTTTQFVWFADSATQTWRVNSVAHRLTSTQGAPTPGTLMARCDAFRQNGAFDSTLYIACDSEWFVRARDRNLPAHRLSAVLLHKRLHDMNLSAQIETYRKEWLQVLRASAVGKTRADQKAHRDA